MSVPAQKRRRVRHCIPVPPYRLVSGGTILTWQRRLPGDSRVDQITCPAEWFYAQMLKAPEEKP